MLKINRFIIILNILLLSSISYASDPWDKRIEEFVFDASRDIKSYFPKVEGYIVHVIDEDVYIDLGINTKVKRGVVLGVLKEGEELRHPVTGKILGIADRGLGYLQILKVRKRYSIARVIQKDNKDDIKTGRKVYVTPEKVSVVIMDISRPEDLDFPDQSFIEGLTNALKDTGRFSIVERSDIDVFMTTNRIDDPKSLKDPVNAEIARNDLGADIILFPYITTFKEKIILGVEAVSLIGGVRIARITKLYRYTYPAKGTVKKIDPHLSPSPSPASRPNIIHGISGFYDMRRFLDINDVITSLGIGDVTGDGSNEIIISTPSMITVYRWREGEIERVWSSKKDKWNKIISIGVADINNNGTAEIFVNNYYRTNTLSSFVVENKEGRFRTILKDKKVFFRVVGDKRLLGQAVGIYHILKGDIMEYRWSKGDYIGYKDITTPGGVDLLRSTLMDLDGDGEDELINIDSKNYLVIYSGSGKEKWKSPEKYGGSNIGIKQEDNGDEKMIEMAPSIIAVPGEKEGEREILVVRNITMSYFMANRYYRKGEFILLRFDGIGYSERLKGPMQDRFISDISYSDIDNDGVKEVVIARVKKLFGGGGKSDLILVNVQRKGER